MPTRRSLAKGVAWTVPVLALGVAAPAYALSNCTPAACLTGPSQPPPATSPSHTSFVTTVNTTSLDNGWTLSTTGTCYGTTDGLIGYQANGFTYGKGWIAPDGKGILASAPTVTIAANTDNSSGTSMLQFTPTRSGLYVLSYVFSFDTASTYAGTTTTCPTFANDLAINAPSVVCT